MTSGDSERPPESPGDDPLALFEAEGSAPAPASPELADAADAAGVRLGPVAASETAIVPDPAPAPAPVISAPEATHAPDARPERPAAVPPAAHAPGVDPAPATAPGEPSIALDTVLARHTPVIWPEAVAVVQAACAALVRVDAPPRLAPDLAGIRLHADGTVAVSDGRPGEPSVVRLARTLHALLPAQGAPPPLRLLATKWIAATDAHGLDAFAIDLAYFARPDGPSHVRALYARAASTTAGAPAALPQPPREEREKPVAAPVRRRPPVWLLPVAAVLSTLAAGGAWYLGESSAPPLPAAVAGLVTGAAGTEPGLEADGTSAAPAGDTVPSPAPPPADPGDIVLRAPGSPRAAAPRAPIQTPSATRTPVPAAGRGPAFIPVPPPLAGTAPDLSVTPDVSGLSPSRIYTSTDRQVVPPSLVYPQLPEPPERADATVAINTMEVVVGEDGRVQTVQLISTPQRMNDMMLLSAAKVWRFAPALLDGEPVPYRMRVSWATTP